MGLILPSKIYCSVINPVDIREQKIKLNRGFIISLKSNLFTHNVKLFF